MTTLKDLNMTTSYNLDQSQIDQYRLNGHILLRDLATPEEIAFFRKGINQLVEKLNTETRDMEDRDTYSKAFLQIMNLWRESEVLKNFVLAKRFAKVAADLMGVEHVRLYHDQALFKEPGGGHTPWHQDQYYWPLDTDNTITMWMPLVDLTKDMGIMNFASGTHRDGYIAEEKISDESEEFFLDYIRDNGCSVFGAESVKAGDATFHSGWTLHNAPENQSDKMREVMTIIYFADKTRVLEPDNDNRKADHKQWLMGVPVGTEANSELNPIVY